MGDRQTLVGLSLHVERLSVGVTVVMFEPIGSGSLMLSIVLPSKEIVDNTLSDSPGD